MYLSRSTHYQDFVSECQKGNISGSKGHTVPTLTIRLNSLVTKAFEIITQAISQPGLSHRF